MGNCLWDSYAFVYMLLTYFEGVAVFLLLSYVTKGHSNKTPITYLES